MHATLIIIGKKYNTVELANAAQQAATVTMPTEYTDNEQTLAGQHHAFIHHDGKYIRVIVGTHDTSRRAKLISKVLLKKALMGAPASTAQVQALANAHQKAWNPVLTPTPPRERYPHTGLYRTGNR